jgi:hypothetical protein
MANLAKSAVSLFNTASTGIAQAEFHLDRPELVCRRLKLVLTGQGDLTNKVTAHSLGFSLLVLCSNLYDTDNDLQYNAMVHISNNIIFGDVADGTLQGVTTDESYITVIGVLDTSAALT